MMFRRLTMPSFAVASVAGGMLTASCSTAGSVTAAPTAVDFIELTAPVIEYRIGSGDARTWSLQENFNGRGDGPFSIGYVPRDNGFAVLAVDTGDAGRVPVCFTYDRVERCYDVSADRHPAVEFRHEDASYPIVIRPRTPDAVFPPAYIAERRGTITVEAPAFNEMLNVALALTPSAQAVPGVVTSDTAYFDSLEAHFSGHGNHGLVERLDAALRDDVLNYYILKTNGLTYQFDSRGRIVPSDIYRRGGFPGSEINDLSSFLSDLQDFADQTEFLEFYASNAGTYQGQIDYFSDRVDLTEMKAWLETNFPTAEPYDAIRVIVSPLMGSVQYVLRYETETFRELQPHVNFPYGGGDNLSAEARPLARGALLFTEINHGYIAPPSELSDSIEAVFSPGFWVASDSDSAQTYATASDLFAEYVNWSLLSLYAFDRLAPDDRDAFIAGVVRTMEDRRDFTHFGRFNARFLELYAQRRAGETAVEMYPALIAWAAEHRAAKQNESLL